MTTTTVTHSLLDLARGRQALLSVAQPGLGAVLALGALPDARTITLGLSAATAGYLAVFSLNDVLDMRSDVAALKAGKGEVDGYDLDTVFDRHPLAAGMLQLRVAIAWVAALVLVAVALGWALNPWCVVVFAVSVALEALYCALRSVTWAKTLVSGIMVGLGGMAGWIAVAPLDFTALFFFLFLAVWEIAGRNMPNDLADLRADSVIGLRTVATTFGPRTASRAIAVGSVATVALVPVMLVPVAGPVTMGAALFAAAVTMGMPAGALLHSPTPSQGSRYFNRSSLLPALVFSIVVVSLVIGGAS